MKNEEAARRQNMNEWRLLRLRTCASENRRAHRWGIQTAKEAVGGVRFGGEDSVVSMRLCEEETGGGKRLTETETFQRRLNGERRSWRIGYHHEGLLEN